jgi:hypothetical protein
VTSETAVDRKHSHVDATTTEHIGEGFGVMQSVDEHHWRDRAAATSFREQPIG